MYENINDDQQSYRYRNNGGQRDTGEKDAVLVNIFYLWIKAISCDFEKKIKVSILSNF